LEHFSFFEAKTAKIFGGGKERGGKTTKTVVFMVIFIVNSLYETWPEEERGRFAGRQIVFHQHELEHINHIRHHPERRPVVLRYLKYREAQIKRDLEWLSAIGEP